MKTSSSGFASTFTVGRTPTLATPRRGARANSMHADSENARQRRAPAQRHVRGRETQRAAELVAVRDAARDRVVAPQQRRRVLEIAGRERRAHRRARCALAVDVDRAHRLDAEPCAPSLRRNARSPWRPRAETEILADEHPAAHAARARGRRERNRPPSAKQGAHRSARRTSIATPYARNSSSFARSVDSRGGAAFRREELARMRLERQHGRRQPQILSGLDQPRQHRLVTAMDAVEVADRQRDRRLPRARQLALYPHSVVHRSSMRHPFNKTRHFSAVAFFPLLRTAMLQPASTSCQPPSTSG